MPFFGLVLKVVTFKNVSSAITNTRLKTSFDETIKTCNIIFKTKQTKIVYTQGSYGVIKPSVTKPSESTLSK